MSSSFLKKSVPVLVIMAFLSVVMIYLIYSLLTPEKKLPIYNPADVNPKLVDESLIHIRRNHKVADFKLINQNGDTITQEDYKDKIYVADFFFTRCQTICPIMTNNMEKLQEVFKNDNDIKFLSLSVTPEMDSIPILREYADRKGVIDAKWNITTGNKKHIYELARKSYFAVLDEGDGGVQDFIHTENFILVDKKKQIRGFYDGTDSNDIQRLITDIQILKNEFKD
ncbi:Cytochrome oxidase biogenesis protein Sco1/SenC/PrrC, thiol-disulfide reductase involved in Cu(I) insertion into CoxII Cu(A) center [hydrothermal vent metagenome]|uniref:Cytochrome oxidase biogenesis protein Sco1/SenC/PrrC, thiol-disulfide reductase involved in Cu(I) insertion into CoxII Cu(A) center n=1 Tax=hydrothermal vent metagenome TaxID=652676 RepID=A0A3B0U8T1_9ZZZZ